MKQVLAIFLALFVCNASAFWRQCHISSPLPNSVSSPACTDAGCTVTRGTALTGTIVFTPTANHQTIELHVRYQAGPDLWQSIPVSPPGNDACLSMTPGCPTVAGVPQTLELNLPVPDIEVPTTNFEFWLAAIAPIPADVACWQSTATIV